MKSRDVKKILYSKHPKDLLFDVVSDVEYYSQFVPYCSNLKIIKIINEHEFLAEMFVGYKGLSQSFTSHVYCSAQDGEVLSKSISGPFEQINTVWIIENINHDDVNDDLLNEGLQTIHEAEGGLKSKIYFELHYKFKNQFLDKLFTPLFDKVFDRYVEAFLARADQIAANKSCY